MTPTSVPKTRKCLNVANTNDEHGEQPENELQGDQKRLVETVNHLGKPTEPNV